MIEDIKKWVKGDSITADRLNAYNRALGIVDDATVSPKLGMLHNGAGKRILDGYREKVLLFELTEDLAIDGSDDVRSALAKRLVLDPDSNTYNVDQSDQTEYRLYHPQDKENNDASPGRLDRVHAKFNYQSSRWEIITGGQGTTVVMFRPEEELFRGMAANARIVDPATLLTKPGPQIIVQDDERKWFARGETAPSGDDGGDPKGNACFGFALKANLTDDGQVGSGDIFSELQVYTVISVGTWYRYITGTLLGDQWEVEAENVTGHDGEWPRSDMGTNTGKITLYPLGCLEAAYGVEFRAIFNATNRHYEVWSACCPE
jgi:hypothetical protein